MTQFPCKAAKLFLISAASTLVLTAPSHAVMVETGGMAEIPGLPAEEAVPETPVETSESISVTEIPAQYETEEPAPVEKIPTEAESVEEAPAAEAEPDVMVETGGMAEIPGLPMEEAAPVMETPVEETPAAETEPAVMVETGGMAEIPGLPVEEAAPVMETPVEETPAVEAPAAEEEGETEEPYEESEETAPAKGTDEWADMAVGVGKTTGSALRMRSGPSADTSVVTTLNKNETLAILDASEVDWYKVSYNGNVGYVSAAYFQETDNESIQAYARISGEGVILREAPWDDSAEIQAVENSTLVGVNSLTDGWYHVTCPGGTPGYVRSDHVEFTSLSSTTSTTSSSKAATSSSSISSKANSIVSTAMKYQGVRYVYGGTTPRAFDCSGFTQYVFKRCGYSSMPRTASEQWNSGLGTRVYSKSSLRAGDLVFFNDPSRNKGKACSHVGIYIGDGKFIHASSGSGKVVVSNLSASYYSRYFKGGMHFA